RLNGACSRAGRSRDPARQCGQSFLVSPVASAEPGLTAASPLQQPGFSPSSQQAVLASTAGQPASWVQNGQAPSAGPSVTIAAASGATGSGAERVLNATRPVSASMAAT